MDALIHAFGLDWRFVGAQIINFVIVLVIIWFVAYKPLMAFLEKRQTMIREGVEGAQRAEGLERRAQEVLKETLAQATTEASDIVVSAQAVAKKTHESALKDAEIRRQALLKDAEAEAHERTRRIEREAQERVLQQATLLAEKIVTQTHG